MQQGNDNTNSIEATLREISARLAVIEQRTAAAVSLADELPALAAIAGDAFDEQMGKLGDAEARVHELTVLLERLSRPATLRALRVTVELLEQAPNTLAILTDTFEETLSNSEARGVRVDEVFAGIMASSKRAIQLVASPEFRTLLDSPLLERGMVDTLGRLAGAIAEASKEPQPPLGFFGVIKAMGRTNVQKAAGFALGVASKLGASLDERATRGALPPGRE